jgi:virginiamycin B lyase
VRAAVATSDDAEALVVEAGARQPPINGDLIGQLQDLMVKIDETAPNGLQAREGQMIFMRLLTTVSFAGLLAGLMIIGASARATSLSGTVSSAEEGLMEGVLVSARKEGATITTTVVSNAKGEFSFPPDRLEPGRYNLTIRAASYALASPMQIDITAGVSLATGIKLAKAKNIAAQLSNGEWIMSAPGSDQVKSFLADCVGCHTLQRVFTAMHTAEEWKNVFARMGRYAPETVPQRPQLLLQGGARSERPRVPASMIDAAADFLVNASMNNPDNEGLVFKRLPRPKGRATNVIITEFALPRKAALPHDVIVDADGHAWYSDFGNQFVGELDPATGKVTDYPLQTLRQDQPKGPLGMEFDPEGNIWIGMSYQAGASKIDRMTKEITTYPLPREWQGITSQTNMVTPTHMDVDGKVWMEDTENGRVFRLDLKSGQWEDRGIATTAAGETIRGYGLPADKDNNLYLMSFADTRIGRLDAKTNMAQIWTTPMTRSRPRRGRFDDHNRLWFAEYAANRIAMFDPASEQIKEWKLPTDWSEPYDVVPTKGAREVWTGSMLTDQVARLDTKTDEIVEYLLPRNTNIRRVFVVDRGPHPALWVGNNHGNAIVRVEPLD